LASQVSNIVKDKGLNVLINNAGISSKFTRIGLVKSEDLLNHFKINTIGPIMLTQVNHCLLFSYNSKFILNYLVMLYLQALLPLLKIASEKNKSVTGMKKAVIVNISSILGSISLNDQGGFYPYRTSKVIFLLCTFHFQINFILKLIKL